MADPLNSEGRTWRLDGLFQLLGAASLTADPSARSGTRWIMSEVAPGCFAAFASDLALESRTHCSEAPFELVLNHRRLPCGCAISQKDVGAAILPERSTSKV